MINFRETRASIKMSNKNYNVCLIHILAMSLPPISLVRVPLTKKKRTNIVYTYAILKSNFPIY